jgi:hypothetical protein
VSRTTGFDQPIPSVAETYLRLTGIDPRSSTIHPAAHTVAVRCVSAANHRHGDASASLHIHLDKDVWVCRVCTDAGKQMGGQSLDLVVHAGQAKDRSDALAWLVPPEPKRTRRPPPPVNERRIAARYAYEDENRTLLYEVIRYEWDVREDDGTTWTDKTFSQRAPLPEGRWANKLDGVRRVPYHYPEMIVLALDESRTLYITEGEKDVDTALSVGLAATTNAGGAAWAWSAEFLACFQGVQKVVVIGDNDEPGRAAAIRRADLLADIVGEVWLVEAMPQVPEKGDLSDWVAAYRKSTPDASPAQVSMKLRTILAEFATKVTPEVDDGSARAWEFSTLHFNILATQKPPAPAPATGFRRIDTEIEGLHAGQTTVYAARTGHGKTAALEHTVIANWEQFKILLFALEMGAKRMHDRLVSRAQAMRLKDYRNAMRPDTVLDKEWYARKKLRIVGKTRKATVDNMIEQIELYRPDIVAIDHLRHIPGWYDLTGKKRGDIAPVDIMDRLMSTASKMGHHNILLSQINREGDGKRPELSHLRDSGAVEEMADNVIILHRPYKTVDAPRTSLTEDDLMEAILRKTREGAEVIAHMEFIGDLMALQAPTPETLDHFTRCCR